MLNLEDIAEIKTQLTAISLSAELHCTPGKGREIFERVQTINETLRNAEANHDRCSKGTRD